MSVAENLGWAALAFAIASLFILNGGGRGPTERLLRYGFILLYVAFDVWMISTALRKFGIISTHQFRVTAVWLASGWTLAGIPVAVRWHRQRRRAAIYADVSTYSQPAHPVGQQSMARVWRYLRWTCEYVFTTLICGDLLLFGKDLSASLTAQSARWGISPKTVHVVLAHGFVLLAGLAYTVIISGAAITILSRSFDQDWAIGRGWNYVLMIGPYLLATLTNGYLYPFLWAGLAAHLLTLFAGWHWTDEPPAGTLATLKLVRNRRDRVRANARTKATGDQCVIALRRGRIIAIDDNRLRVVEPGVLQGKCTLAYSSSALLLMNRTRVVRLKLTDISGVQFARPARLQLLAGGSAAPIMSWQDGTKRGALAFALQLEAAREAARSAAAQKVRC